MFNWFAPMFAWFGVDILTGLLLIIIIILLVKD